MKKQSHIQKGIVAGLGLAALGMGGYYLAKTLPKIFSCNIYFTFLTIFKSVKEAKMATKIKSLTKFAAQSRASHITGYIDYKLLLNLKEGNCYTGIVQQNFVIKNQNASIFLDYNGEKIKQLIVNRQPVKSSQEFKEIWDGSFINIPSDSLVPGNNQIEIWFENQYCKDGQGLHSFVDTDKKQYIYSNLEPYWASRIFPCMDQPNLKGKFELIVINPKSHVCIANEERLKNNQQNFNVFSKAKKKDNYDGNIIVKEIGETDIDILEFLKNIDGNSNILVFPPTKYISSYLFAVISGPFKQVKCENTYKDIQMTCYCRESLFEEMQKCAQQLFQITIEAMKFYENLFQYPYPFSKYDSIFCPEYNVKKTTKLIIFKCGAMENVGAVTFNDGYLFKGDVALEKISRRAQTITHELAHMWFGNLVTMDWWDDLWLNESFADFVALYCLREISQKFTFQLSDFGVMSNMRKIWGYREDGKISTHPIAAEVNDTDEADSIFDGITYSKGQAVIRQLLNLLGRDNFSKGLSEYFKKYEYKNATFKDFLASLQKHFQLQEDPSYTLNIWAEEWLKTESYNEVTPVWNVNNFSEKAQVEIIQECVQDKFPTLRHHKMQLAFYGENGVLLEVKSVLIKAEKSTMVSYDGSKKVKGILLNYEDDCFIKVILDSISLDFFKQNLHKIQQISSRNLIWRALYDMVHDGKLSSAELINLAVEQLPNEQEIVLVTLVFMFCRLSVSMFTPMKAKPLLKQKMFAMILNQLKNQQMENSTRMSFQDELVANAVGLEQLNYMEQFLAVEGQKEIVLTVEQKWVIAQAFGRSQEHEKAKKLEILELVAKQDQSSDGKLQYETIQTTIYQTEQEKMKTWEKVMDPKSTRSLFSSIAIMKGFNLDETWETSQKFHDLFFKNLISVFKERQLQFAQNYFAWLFPKTEDFPYLIQKVEETMSKVPQNMQTLMKLLVGVRDEINVKMRAVEAYSQFEATLN